ncbi:MAG: amidohydrolase/deacetylase family metallohydrolase [Chloroflexi bacterium]|nr:amidohydrolase/deacetylase family metallohydrolase [Chloroflexota bacterium]
MTQQAQYDLLLRGGNLLDPAQKVNASRDVAFRGGRVAAVAARIDPAQAREVIDVTGKLVTPGLIDAHGHFYHGSNPSPVHPDKACLPSGVTTAVDGGTAGWANFPAMRDYVFPAQKVRLLAFLHIGALGLAPNRAVGGELRDIRLVDPDHTAETVRQNRGLLLGVKVRMHVEAVAYWEARSALKAARLATDRCGGKLMIHVSGTPIPLPEVLEVLGPGDIMTHAFNGNPENMIGHDGKVRPQVRAAAERGVVMDVGDAGVHCDINVVKAAMRDGLLPTTISTDIHTPPPGRVVYKQHELLAKFMALGMSLEQVVAASTSASAKVIGLDKEIGSLGVGMAGDAAVFTQEEGRFTYQDMAGNHVVGDKRLVPVLTIKDGQVVWRAG